jgi:hypothetical protein
MSLSLSNNTYVTKVYLNVILLPMPRSSQWSLTFGHPTQNPANTSPLPHVCPKESIQVRDALKHFVTGNILYGEGLLVPHPTPKLEDHPCRLSATAYSIYSQLPSVSRGLLSTHNLRTRHAVVTWDPPNTGCADYRKNIFVVTNSMEQSPS